MADGVKDYDVLVVGSGSGANVVDAALGSGLSVGWVDKGPLGGTCLNVGCIPSKMLIVPADRIVEIQEAARLGIEAHIDAVDFASIMEYMRQDIAETQGHIRSGLAETENLDLYEAEGHFVDDYTLQVGDRRIRGEKVYLAAGTRVFIPPIEGIDQVDYLTNESVLALTERPESLIIIGGGYVATEFGHFFAAMGTQVTIVEMLDRLVNQEEPEISELLQEKLSERMEVHVGTQAIAVRKGGAGVVVVGKDLATGEQREFAAQRLMVAVGRRSNADLLQVEASGIELDKRGFIKVNEYLETSKPNIWAFGDINGQYLFTHAANQESAVVWRNSMNGSKVTMDYSAMPHAVYSHPQIAGVGLTEAKAREQGDPLVGVARYFDVAKGQAMREESGFAKAIVDRESSQILGFHIIGPYAPMLIQEVVTAMANGATVRSINSAIHIHPALSELIVSAVNSLHAHH